MPETILPEGFADLEGLAAWSLATETERSRRRRASTYDELCAFYAAISPRVVEALEYLDAYEVGALPEREQRLFDLCLSYAEIAPFVEQYHRVAIPESFDEARFVATHDLPR